MLPAVVLADSSGTVRLHPEHAKSTQVYWWFTCLSPRDCSANCEHATAAEVLAAQNSQEPGSSAASKVL